MNNKYMTMSREETGMACLICKKEAAFFFTKKNNHNVYRCKNCGHLFVYPQPIGCAEIYQKSYFSGEGNFGYSDYDGDKEVLLDNFNKYLKKIDQFIATKGKMFDVGAATGNFIELAKKQGWSASGMELSEEACLIGAKKGLEIMKGNFESANIEQNDFDVVTFLDVLEHFIDPVIALINAKGLLKFGGLLVINTPDSSSVVAKILGRKWHLIAPPEHPHCFSLGSLEMLLKKNNFELLYVDRISKRFSLRYIFKTLANWQKFFAWDRAYSYLKNKRLGKISIPINTMDNIFIIAKKKV